MQPANRRTALFVKEPLPGRVKTRLIPALGPEGAAQLQQAMLADLLDLHRQAGAPLELAVYPPAALGRLLEAYPDAVGGVGQAGLDLGQRLGAWFDEGQEGQTQVVMGADCPLVDAAFVAQAHSRLEAGIDAVFAPDGGGGYSLVGLRRPVPGLFEIAPLSTEDNLECTLDEALKRGLKVELLPERRDVDQPGDLERLMRDLNSAARSQAGHYPRRTAHALSRLLEPNVPCYAR